MDAFGIVEEMGARPRTGRDLVATGRDIDPNSAIFSTLIKLGNAKAFILQGV